MSLAPRFAILTLGALSLVATAGCDKEKTDAAASAAKCSTPDAKALHLAGCEPAAGGAGEAASSGSAATTGSSVAAGGNNGPFAYCQFTKNDKGGGCFSCTPRDLELLKCAKELKDGFDPAQDCSHDDAKDVMTCETGTNDDFVWELGTETKTEAIYGKLPLLLAGAKLLLADKFKDDPKKLVVLDALDLLAKHAKTLFSGGDVAAVADDVVALAKKAKPSLKDAELQGIKTQLTSVAADLQAKRKAGAFEDADMITLIAAFVTSLPPDLIGGFGGTDISVLLGALSGGNLEDLLKQVAGSGTGTGS